MIYLTQNIASSAYTTALENYTGTTYSSAWTFSFKSDSTNYTYSPTAILTNNTETGTTLKRYECFYFDASNTAFEYLGYYTYTISHPVTGEVLEIGRAKVSSLTSGDVVEDKPKYKETSPKKKTYKS